jgi:hypothetical protein
MLFGKKVVLLTLKEDLAKWVNRLKEQTQMSDEEVIEGALYLLRLATSTKLGRYYVAQALKASGILPTNGETVPPSIDDERN